MRILIISRYYTPENVMIPPSIATALASLGHEARAQGYVIFGLSASTALGYARGADDV